MASTVRHPCQNFKDAYLHKRWQSKVKQHASDDQLNPLFSLPVPPEIMHMLSTGGMLHLASLKSWHTTSVLLYF